MIASSSFNVIFTALLKRQSPLSYTKTVNSHLSNSSVSTTLLNIFTPRVFVIYCMVYLCGMLTFLCSRASCWLCSMVEDLMRALRFSHLLTMYSESASGRDSIRSSSRLCPSNITHSSCLYKSPRETVGRE